MNRLFSNGPSKDYVINPFRRLMTASARLYLAAPYFTAADDIRAAAKAGKPVQLIAGLNPATSPQALALMHGIPGVAVRYLTHRFHAKIFIFDDAALVGSSNLTDGGLFSNREATLCFDRPEDLETVEELRALFLELWDSAQVLTAEKLAAFTAAHRAARPQGPDPDAVIEKAVGRAEPMNINVASAGKSRERLFLEQLRQQVYEQYRPAFAEVTGILTANEFRRPELAGIGIANETNRFLNWVRLTNVLGDEAWQTAPLRPQQERENVIVALGREWTQTGNSRVPSDYIAWLDRAALIFGSPEAIAAASKDEVTEGLMSIHAFVEMARFVRGGADNLPGTFWKANGDDLAKVKDTLSSLLHGGGDFIQRLHDLLYEPGRKLDYFGRFCVLELYGTIKPADERPHGQGVALSRIRREGPMSEDVLPLTPGTLLVFIDETGNEDYSDPKNPTFGRGGCAVLGRDYRTLVKKPWQQLKRGKLGGAAKPFHATAFEQSRPSLGQITAINRFLQRPFWRFAVMSDARTALPPGIDGHKAVSLITIRFIENLVATYRELTNVALVFEGSERGDKLVERDFDLANMKLVTGSGRRLEVDGYFMKKAEMEAGLEVADLVAHTAGRQRRHQLASKDGAAPDFRQMYWHSPIPPAFMSIGTVQLNELAIENSVAAHAASDPVARTTEDR